MNPSPKVLAQLKELVVHGHAPIAVRESPNLLFKCVQRVRMPVNLTSFKCESKELTFIGFNDVAFDRVNDQLQAIQRSISISLTCYGCIAIYLR